MTTARKPSQSSAANNRDPVRDSLVVLCMTVVALALGIGLHLQFALAFWLAVVAALSVYVALLSTHVLVRRNEHVEQLRRELARFEAQAGRPPQSVRREASALAASSSLPPAREAKSLGDVKLPSAQFIANGAERLIEPAAGAVADFGDYWNFSPKNADSANLKNATVAVPPGPGAVVPIAPATAQSASAHVERVLDASPVRLPPQPTKQQREADIDQINAVIKKLAADITQGQAAMAHSAKVQAANVAPPSPQPQEAPKFRAYPPSVDMDASVAALHAAADAMRHAGKGFEPERRDADLMQALPRDRMAPAVMPSPPPVPQRRLNDPARDRLAAIAEALENERLDVMLEPILGLGDRRAQHYVVSVRLWGDQTDMATQTDMGHVARGSGLLPLLDAIKVERAARVAWRMEDRGKPGSLFSSLSGESLVSDRFLNRFADTYRQGDTLGSRLVLSFTQSDLRVFSELQWSTLRDMADLGFRFSLEDITDLDFDFDALVKSGFAFVKLDAGVFLNGLPAAGGLIPAADVCRYVGRLGMALIVGGITDDALAAQLKSYGVELAQGPLFGQPRPVKADVLRNPHAAVA